MDRAGFSNKIDCGGATALQMKLALPASWRQLWLRRPEEVLPFGSKAAFKISEPNFEASPTSGNKAIGMRRPNSAGEPAGL
jgi:hypothetical protein